MPRCSRSDPSQHLPLPLGALYCALTGRCSQSSFAASIRYALSDRASSDDSTSLNAGIPSCSKPTVKHNNIEGAVDSFSAAPQVRNAAVTDGKLSVTSLTIFRVDSCALAEDTHIIRHSGWGLWSFPGGLERRQFVARAYLEGQNSTGRRL